MKPYSVFLLFRNAQSGQYSIERVFFIIKKYFPSDLNIREVILPFSNSGTWNKVKNIVWMRSIRGNIHVTGDVYYAVLLKSRNVIATIHDIGVLGDVSRLKKWIIKFIWFDRLAANASKLIFISNQSRNDFLNRVKTDVNKTKVIYNPLPEDYSFSPLEFNAPKPNILHIGTKENKNLRRTCEALKGIPCLLTIVGKLNEDQRKALADNNIEFVNVMNVSDNEIRDVYVRSDMLCFASVHEGFGMPIIEAQAIGRPVITSNVSSMPEIAGEGACFVDPYDVTDIRKAVLKIINDPAYRLELISKGRENVKRFKPELIAAQYLEVYNEVFGKK